MHKHPKIVEISIDPRFPLKYQIYDKALNTMLLIKYNQGIQHYIQ